MADLQLHKLCRTAHATYSFYEIRPHTHVKPETFSMFNILLQGVATFNNCMKSDLPSPTIYVLEEATFKVTDVGRNMYLDNEK